MVPSAPFPDQARTLGSLLRAPYRRLADRLYADLAANGFPEIRPAHSAVFRHISPDGSRLTDMAEQAELTKQSMAYLVGYLEEHGYVTLHPDPDDGRAKLVRLTRRGQAFIAALLKASAAVEDDLAAALGATKLKQLRDLLEQADAALTPAQES
jgi:DNA-binding MarR family transcriptional regulator